MTAICSLPYGSLGNAVSVEPGGLKSRISRDEGQMSFYPSALFLRGRCCEDLTEKAIVERRTRDNVSLVLLVFNKWY